MKGNIKNLDGKVIGVHDGIVNFTIGQRKGIKIAEKDPLYVIKINSNKIFVLFINSYIKIFSEIINTSSNMFNAKSIFINF